MEAIVDYAKANFEFDFRNNVSLAIGRGWDVFDSKTYLETVFSQLQTLSLAQTQVSDVSPLKGLKNLIICTEDEKKAERWKASGFQVKLLSKD